MSEGGAAINEPNPLVGKPDALKGELDASASGFVAQRKRPASATALG